MGRGGWYALGWGCWGACWTVTWTGFLSGELIFSHHKWFAIRSGSKLILRTNSYPVSVDSKRSVSAVVEYTDQLEGGLDMEYKPVHWIDVGSSSLNIMSLDNLLLQINLDTGSEPTN